MEQIKLFDNPQFGSVRTISNEKGIWFVGRDVANILEYANTRKAILDHVDEEDKAVTKCDTLGGKQEAVVINESGLYSLILSSKMQSAKDFKHWITSEVLPAIRKNGGYIANQENLSDEELLAKAILVAHKTIEEKNRQIETMTPKAIFADAVSVSRTSILIGELAKLITQNGTTKIGANRLFEWMRENGYLIKSGSSKNMPTQRYVEQGLFEIKESILAMPDGAARTTKTTKVTGKGQIYFVNKFLRK